MKKITLLVLYLVSLLLVGFFGYWFAKNGTEIVLKSPGAKIIPRPLEKYTYDNLKIRGGIASEVKIERTLKVEDEFTSYLFSYVTNGKRVTGQMNIPNGAGPYPTILMFRGYAEKETYKIGTGTAPSAKVYANNGYLTFAPDFLGYGESDVRTEDQIEARLENYTTALDALASIKNIKEADSNNVFIWGHSNGGHLAVATLEISGKPIPTTLWAPVTAPFPHSALFFQDELFDKGKTLRKDIAKFEELYDVFKYSPDNYIDWLKAPIQLHQGTLDESVPKKWSDEFVKVLKEKEKDNGAISSTEITYFVYQGTDHNMRPAWDTVVARDMMFFRKHTK